MLKQLETSIGQKRRLDKREYSRILSAAVINSNFRHMLLRDPAQAISNGYSGEKFDIDRDEAVRLSSIRATSLADFATQLSNIYV